MKLFNKEYKIIENHNEAFNEEEFLNKCTDYFSEFDYIVGDIAYGKLRLKGFNKNTNKNYKEINDYNKIEKYIKENCAYGCKYFIIEKENAWIKLKVPGH